jgi:hypothetical protein
VECCIVANLRSGSLNGAFFSETDKVNSFNLTQRSTEGANEGVGGKIEALRRSCVLFSEGMVLLSIV